MKTHHVQTFYLSVRVVSRMKQQFLIPSLSFCFETNISLKRVFKENEWYLFFFILGILGVAPSNLSSYKPNLMGLFACLSGELSISWTSVNDDYCDCPDGSDEPGTGACPNTRWTHQARDKLNYSKIDQIEIAAEQAAFFAVRHKGRGRNDMPFLLTLHSTLTIASAFLKNGGKALSVVWAEMEK